MSSKMELFKFAKRIRIYTFFFFFDPKFPFGFGIFNSGYVALISSVEMCGLKPQRAKILA